MGRSILIITVVWSLVGAPMLCRAGVLVRCCAGVPEEDPPTDRAGCENGCCGQPSESDSAPAGERRECGSCVSLCDAVAKPNDDDLLARAPELAAGTADFGFDTAQTPPVSCGPAADRPPDIPRIPFPHSDIPLLM